MKRMRRRRDEISYWSVVVCDHCCAEVKELSTVFVRGLRMSLAGHFDVVPIRVCTDCAEDAVLVPQTQPPNQPIHADNNHGGSV